MSNNRRHHFNKKPQREDNYAPPYGEEILSRPITDLKLREDTLNLLTGARVLTLSDVLKREEKDFYKISTFNKKNLFDVLNSLKPLNVQLKPSTVKDAPKGEPRVAVPVQNAQAREQRVENHPSRTFAPRENDRFEKRRDKHPANTYQRAFSAAPVDNFCGTVKPDRGPRPVVIPEKEEPDIYVKVNKGGKWGFNDRSGKLVVAPTYDEVFSFKEDVCCVEKEELYGYINRAGEEIISPQYSLASSFSEGYACVFKHDKCGYINKENQTVIDFKYEAGTQIIGGECRVKRDGRWGELHVEDPGTVRWIN